MCNVFFKAEEKCRLGEYAVGSMGRSFRSRSICLIKFDTSGKLNYLFRVKHKSSFGSAAQHGPAALLHHCCDLLFSFLWHSETERGFDDGHRLFVFSRQLRKGGRESRKTTPKILNPDAHNV